MRKIIFILVFSILFSACSAETEVETTTEEFSAAVVATTTTIFVQPSEERAKEIDNLKADLSLKGIPLGIKDLFCTKNMPTTAGSKILKNFQNSM